MKKALKTQFFLCHSTRSSHFSGCQTQSQCLELMFYHGMSLQHPGCAGLQGRVKQMWQTAPRAAGPQECCSHVPPTQSFQDLLLKHLHQLSKSSCCLGATDSLWNLLKSGKLAPLSKFLSLLHLQTVMARFPQGCTGCGTWALGAHIGHFWNQPSMLVKNLSENRFGIPRFKQLSEENAFILQMRTKIAT